MKFHGITMIGEYRAQTVLDVSTLPAPGTNDVRRLVYDQNSGTLWIADSSVWKGTSAYGDIPKNTEMWFYQDSEPDGWALDTTPSDDLLAVKGGGTYITGGPTGGSQGTFTTPDHAHDMNNHAHSVTGTATRLTAGEERGDHGDSGSNEDHTHILNVAVGGNLPTSTTTDGGVPGYRPLSRVGIICSKN